MGYKKGFTLVQLLVTLAIIGILSGVVLTAIIKSRDQAKDKAISSDLMNMKAAAAVMYYASSPNSYATVCTSGDAKNNFDLANGLSSGGSNNQCLAIATAWGANVKLVAKSDTWYCVDSTGFQGEKTTDTIGTNDYSCQ